VVQEDRVDVAALVAEVEAEVARRRAAGDYPEELLLRLRAGFAVEEESEPPEALAIVESSRPLRSTRPVVGPAVVFGKRVLRRLLSWYVHPAVHDQNRFNLALLRDLRALEARLERLERQAGRDGDEAHG
jgi:O-antigen chain-terminating methyltransferase